MHRQSLDEWKLPVAHDSISSSRWQSSRTLLNLCIAAVSLDDDLVDALIGSIRGHIISFKAFHHRATTIYRLIRYGTLCSPVPRDARMIESIRRANSARAIYMCTRRGTFDTTQYPHPFAHRNNDPITI